MKLIKIIFSVIIVIIIEYAFPSDIFADEPLSDWNQTTSLEYNISGHSSFYHSNSIVVINGSNFIGTTHPNIWKSNIHEDGQLSNWNTIAYIQPPLIQSNIAIKGNSIYLLGGLIDNINNVYKTVDSVYTSNATSSFTVWDNTDNLNSSTALGGTTIIGEYLYYLGGYERTAFNNANIYHNEVLLNHLNPDGSLSNWDITTSLRPDMGQGLTNLSVVETGNKIITMGGKTVDNFGELYATRKVFQAEINPDTGEIGDWKEIYPLPDNYYGYVGMGAIRVENYIIVVGGTVFASQWGSPAQNTNLVFYTTINPDGSINNWQTSNYPLPIVSGGGSLVSNGEYLYYIGGYSTQLGGYHNRVYYTKLNLDSGNGDGEILLDINDFKQNSEPWGSQEYDFAKSWYPSNPSVARWGCAVTSAAMVLDYHGHGVDPESLNNWLKDQPDGYTPNGGAMWPAISRYTKLHESESSPTLEFTYLPFSEDTLISEMSADIPRPPIVKFQKPNGNTHFLVIKGKDDTDYQINDPASTRKTLDEAESYWGDPINIGKLLPVTSDLSYIVMFINDNFDLKIENPSGDEIGEGYFLEEGPLVAADDSNVNSGDVLKAFYYPKPATGIYNLNIKGDEGEAYQIYSYLYDTNGNPYLRNIDGTLNEVGSAEYEIYFFNDTKYIFPIGNNARFIFLLEDLKILYDDGLIKNEGLYQSVSHLIQNSQNNFLKNKNMSSEVLLEAALAKLRLSTPDYIDEVSSQILQAKIALLINSL